MDCRLTVAELFYRLERECSDTYFLLFLLLLFFSLFIYIYIYKKKYIYIYIYIYKLYIYIYIYNAYGITIKTTLGLLFVQLLCFHFLYYIIYSTDIHITCYIQLFWIISNYTSFNSLTCYITINRTISVWNIV